MAVSDDTLSMEDVARGYEHLSRTDHPLTA